MRVALLTISTSKAAGRGVDESAARLERFARELGGEVVAREVLPDVKEAIEGALRRLADGGACELILTSGGTGLSPDDLTPEATRAVIDREVPGIGEAMRAASRPHTPHWMLSRGLAGVRGRALIVNFPGSPRSIGEIGEALSEALPHALALIAGSTTSRH